MTEWNLIQQAISTIGFPIFVAVYLLVWNRKTLNTLRESIVKLTEAITKLCEKDNKNA